MGAYLSEPNLHKESVDDHDERISYGASSMQGWRIDQEDAHNSILNFDKNSNSAFFAVYDGHGGSEVAQYCAKYLPDYLKHLDEFLSGNYEEALKKVFLKFDESLLTPEAQKELKDLREINSRKTSIKDDEEEAKVDDVKEAGQGDEEETPPDDYASEAAKLYDEATMPLEEVLKRYSNTENKIKKALRKKGVLKPGPSPCVTAAASSRLKDKPISSAAEFQEQEEIDINEIKKNSKIDDESLNHEQDYDEASNLGEISESQKSTSSIQHQSKSVVVAQSTVEITTEAVSCSSSNTKLNKEEIKLSPIRKKSLSTSSLIEDLSSITTETTILNGSTATATDTATATTPAVDEENKENDSNSNLNEDKKDLTEDSETTEITKISKKKSKKLSDTNLIAKFIAGVVNSKLRQNMRNKKDSKSSTVEEDDEEDEDDDYEGDDDEDEDEEEEDEDEDEEEEDEDEEYQEEDEDEEDEDFDIEGNQGAGLESRPGYDSGCTAVVALLKDNKQLYVANAGDSRCVVCRDGKAVDMSADHKPEDDLERERIEKAGGTVTKDGRVNGGLNLSRAIGDHSYKANKDLPLSDQMISSLPDIKVLEIDPVVDKFMVLACDGIWNFMSSQEVCDYVGERLDANYAKLSQICEELFMHCLAPNSDGDGTGCDNMTCIIVTFNPFRKIELKMSSVEIADKISLKRSFENESTNEGDAGLVEDSGSEESSKKLKKESEGN